MSVNIQSITMDPFSSEEQANSTTQGSASVFITKKNCPMCDKDVPVVTLLAHIPQCYIAFCRALNVFPLCTCEECEGQCAHPRGRKRLLENGQQGPRRGGSRIEEQEEKQKDTPRLGPKSLTTDQLQGKVCILSGIDGIKCPKINKQQALPLISIGLYRQIVIHMQGHIKDDEQREKIADLIQEQLNWIKEVGDRRSAKVRAQGQPEVESKKEDTETRPCTGYREIYPRMKCNGMTDGILSIKQQSTDRLCFCSGNCLVNFLFVTKNKGKKEKKEKDST